MQLKLGVHLLKAVAFVSEIENAVVIRVRSAVGVLLHQSVQTFGSFIANFDHQSPRCADLRQVLFLPGAYRDGFLDGQQLGFKLARFGMERRAKLTGNGSDSTLKTREHLFT